MKPATTKNKKEKNSKVKALKSSQLRDSLKYQRWNFRLTFFFNDNAVFII